MRVSENEEDKHTTDDYWLKLAGMKFETGATDHCRLDQEYNLVNICKCMVFSCTHLFCT